MRLLPVVLGVLLFAGVAAAQDRRGAPAAGGQAAGRRSPRVITVDTIVIEGRIQKPNAFYILNRSNLGYEVLDLRTSFVRDVVSSVQRQPF